jgi:hypothetical protein
MKNPTILCFILLLATIATAQTAPSTAPTSGGGLQQLTMAIQNNTAAQIATQKKVEDSYGFIAETYRYTVGSQILGVCLFNLSAYLIIVLIDNLRRKKHKKTTEIYLKELEDRISRTEEGLIKSLHHINDQSTELLAKNQEIHEQNRIIAGLTVPEIKQINRQSFLFGCITVMALLIAFKKMGVF